MNRFIPNAHAEEAIRARFAQRDCRHFERDLVTAEVVQLTRQLADTKARLARLESAETTQELRRILYQIAALFDAHYAA